MSELTKRVMHQKAIKGSEPKPKSGASKKPAMKQKTYK
jgi:hypothetical protein